MGCERGTGLCGSGWCQLCSVASAANPAAVHTSLSERMQLHRARGTLRSSWQTVDH